MEHPTPNPPETAAGHETHDPAPSPVLIFVVSLVVTLVVVHLLAWWALGWLRNDGESTNRMTFPPNSIAGAMPTTPPDPRLEPEPSHDVLPLADLIEVRAREQSLIGDHAWGWVDSSHHFARIPIEQAMNLAVERGLPDSLPATQPSMGPYMPPASTLHGPGGIP
jgi:hypothetical protein